MTKGDFNVLRKSAIQALWPKKSMICEATSLMLADKEGLEPWTTVVKRILTNWKARVGDDIMSKIENSWDRLGRETGVPKGPVNWHRRILSRLGWVAHDSDNYMDEKGKEESLQLWGLC